ncbi:MAG: Coq4 family protein [Planctomycetota bacterium]
MRLFGKTQSESHSSHVHYFTTLKGVVGMLRNPEHTESVFDIEDGLRDIEAYQLALQHVRTFPRVREIIDARYVAPPADIEALLRCPENSLGYAYAHHIVDHGFDPDYFRKLEVNGDLDYLLLRIRQTHDIWHVVTGIDTSRIGELTLKAFELAQIRRPMAAVLAVGGVMRYLLKDPENLEPLLRGVSLGYRLGLAAKPLLAERWEEDWDRPLERWRIELGLDPRAADPNVIAHRSGNDSASADDANER